MEGMNARETVVWMAADAAGGTDAGLFIAIRDALSPPDSGALTFQCALQNRKTPDVADRTEAFLALCRKKLEA
jgi:hypothetical protein